MLVRDQRGAFRHDEFLALLAHQTKIRFAAFEHAPPEERRDRFREALAANQLPLTFVESGINVTVEMATTSAAAGANVVDFESAAFVFSGVLVRLRGHIDRMEMEGQARLELFDAPQNIEDPPALSSEQLLALRNLGLPA